MLFFLNLGFMESLMIIFGIIGGLALFIYGIYLLSEGLQKAAGKRLKIILRKINRPAHQRNSGWCSDYSNNSEQQHNNSNISWID